MAKAKTTSTGTDKYMFSGTRDVIDLTSYMLMRGVTDFGNLEQFNLYESGYSFFVVMQIPEFMRRLITDDSDEYSKIIKNYAHILEFENRGISGIDNITTENGQLTNGINQINIINKVNKPSDSSFSASYQEKLGSTITKAHEIFLQGIKDPRTQVKTYLGLIAKGMPVGYQYEVFRFMYIVCDNTLTQIEKAICIASAQIKSVPLDIYNSEKGNYEFKEINVEFDGFPIMGKQVNAVAKKFRERIFQNTVWTEPDMEYSGFDDSLDAVATTSTDASVASIEGYDYFNRMNDTDYENKGYGGYKMTSTVTANTSTKKGQ